MTVIVKSNMPLVERPAVRKQAGLKSGDELEFRVSGPFETADEAIASINANLRRRRPAAMNRTSASR